MKSMINKKQKLTESVLHNGGWELRYQTCQNYIMKKKGIDRHKLLLKNGLTQNLSLTEVDKIENKC